MVQTRCCVKTVLQRRENSTAVAGVRCKRWECPDCGPRKRRAVARKAASGHPQRLITPTVNTQAFDTPEDAARALRRAWTTLMQEIRRRWPGVDHQYMCVFEVTKAGWPHLHVLYRGTYLPQKWLSEKMGLYIQSPIVDIRKVKGKKQAINYVSKYLSKGTVRLDPVYRYSSSRRWVLDREPENPYAWKNYGGFIQILDGHPDYYRFIFQANGFIIEGEGTYFEARPPPGGALHPKFYEH